MVSISHAAVKTDGAWRPRPAAVVSERVGVAIGAFAQAGDRTLSILGS